MRASSPTTFFTQTCSQMAVSLSWLHNAITSPPLSLMCLFFPEGHWHGGLSPLQCMMGLHSESAWSYGANQPGNCCWVQCVIAEPKEEDNNQALHFRQTQPRETALPYSLPLDHELLIGSWAQRTLWFMALGSHAFKKSCPEALKDTSRTMFGS